jgi:hypothetical protein
VRLKVKRQKPGNRREVGFFFPGVEGITRRLELRTRQEWIPVARKEANCMRKAAFFWAGVPTVAAVVGVALWFTLIPGRSGAG